MVIDVTERDNNTVIAAHLGDKLSIRLQWNPSSGYFWQEGDSTAGSLDSVKHEGENPKPGASAFVSFAFKIERTGVLVLSYARPWAETEQPAKWFEVSVTVVA